MRIILKVRLDPDATVVLAKEVFSVAAGFQDVEDLRRVRDAQGVLAVPSEAIRSGWSDYVGPIGSDDFVVSMVG